MEGLAPGINRGLHIFAEVRIGYRSVAQFLFMRPGQRDAFRELSARSWRRQFYNGDGTMVLLDDDLVTFPHSSQDGMDVAGEFVFCNTDRHLSSIIAVRRHSKSAPQRNCSFNRRFVIIHFHAYSLGFGAI